MKLYHYTTSDSFPHILKGIEPRSNPLIVARGISEAELTATVISMKSKRYVVALNHPVCPGWVEHGLYDILINKVMIDYGFAVKLLEFDLEGTDVYVRDHIFWTPTDPLDRFGVNESNVSSRKAYLNSTLPLSDYKGNFKAPEFWIPTPQRNLRVQPLPQRAREIVETRNGYPLD